MGQVRKITNVLEFKHFYRRTSKYTIPNNPASTLNNNKTRNIKMSRYASKIYINLQITFFIGQTREISTLALVII